MMYDHYYGGYGGGYDAWGFVFMFFVIVLLLIGGVIVVRALARGSAEQEHDDKALDILRQRYAKGEIDKKEYDQKRNDLGA